MLNKINHIIPALFLQPKYRFLRHLIIQLSVLLITVNIMWDEPVRILPERFGGWLLYFFQINLIIYINMYLLVPRLLLKGRTWLYLLIVVILIFMIMFSIALYQSMDENQDDALKRTPALLGIMSGFSAFVLFIGGLTTLQLFKYRMVNRHRIDELQNATMEIELANLQNQINPHFLFNMLNNANIMAGENAGKSSYMLSKLNDLLRYQVEEGSKETVKLKDDITFIGDYLELEKMRRDRFNYTIHSEGNTDIDVPPLLFIPFVENAVKHNPENDSYVEIIFRMKNQHVYFECKNPKARLTYTKKEGGIGLVNIKKRLDLLFGKNYSLHLLDEKESYRVKMEFRM